VYKQPEAVRVSGTITLDGEPISGGTIIFQPVNPDPSGVNSGMQVQILNGRYSLIGAQGLLPGDYRVKLQCQRVIDKNTKQDYTGNTDDASAFTVIDVIPEQFNTKSEIIFTVEEKKGAKTFDYDVKTK